MTNACPALLTDFSKPVSLARQYGGGYQQACTAKMVLPAPTGKSTHSLTYTPEHLCTGPTDSTNVQVYTAVVNNQTVLLLATTIAMEKVRQPCLCVSLSSDGCPL